jgi:hypothetical protein
LVSSPSRGMRACLCESGMRACVHVCKSEKCYTYIPH